jgi:hypothetical protein
MSNVTSCDRPCKTAKAQSVLLRADRISMVALDVLLALLASYKRWRTRRRTLQALAKLDDHQLRDIGITRGASSPWWSAGDKSHRALANLDDSQLIHLSDIGRRIRRELRHGTTD